MKSVDELEGRELDAVVQHEAMDSVIGWILMENGNREPVFVPRLNGGPEKTFAVHPKWVPLDGLSTGTTFKALKGNQEKAYEGLVPRNK